jgi:hypothetical protein
VNYSGREEGSRAGHRLSIYPVRVLLVYLGKLSVDPGGTVRFLEACAVTVFLV